MPDKIEPHFYQYGGFEVMGDCGFCGHVEDDPIHIARGGRMTDKHKGKLSAKDVQDAQDEEAREAVRGLCRAVGHALSLTIMSACLPAGHSAEDEAIEAATSAWETLADKIVDFAKEN